MPAVADIVPTPRDMAEAHCHKKTLGQGYQNGFEAGVAAERERRSETTSALTGVPRVTDDELAEMAARHTATATLPDLVNAAHEDRGRLLAEVTAFREQVQRLIDMGEREALEQARREQTAPESASDFARRMVPDRARHPIAASYFDALRTGVMKRDAHFAAKIARLETVATTSQVASVVEHLLAAAREREEWIDMGTPLARVAELNDQIKTLRAAAAILAE